MTLNLESNSSLPYVKKVTIQIEDASGQTHQIILDTPEWARPDMKAARAIKVGMDTVFEVEPLPMSADFNFVTYHQTNFTFVIDGQFNYKELKNVGQDASNAGA